MVEHLGFTIIEFRVQGLACRVQNLKLRVKS
jgi:hypothetical protein